MSANGFRKIIILLIILMISATGFAGVVINEFMASNATSITDEDGDNEDWIELYNHGSEPVDLEGWGLSDDYTDFYKWTFPQVTLEPGEYLLVWASGKDRTEGPLHTNFRIRSAGEELILVKPDGNWADEVLAVHVPTDISYGRYPNGTGPFFWFLASTPGEPNADEGFEELLAPPEFSHAPGFYTDSFFLKVHHPDPEVSLHYTTDGSVPNTTSDIFPDSLLIYNRKNDPDQISAIPTTGSSVSESFRWFPPMDTVFKGTSIRVKAYKQGALNPYVQTRTWWVDDDIHNRYSMPLIAINMEEDDLLGSHGIYTNYNSRGINWERDMHIAFFDTLGQEFFSTDAGIRVHGGNSRRYALKSFRIYFRNSYGESNMEYPVFAQQEMNTHDRLILRNAGSDWKFTYYRDAFVQSLLHGFSDVEKQAYQPAVVFLNSEYWGMLNIRERFDNNYIENHYGYTEIDMLDNTGQVKYGSNSHYNNLISFLHNNDLVFDDNYNWVKEQMDVEDFRDYHILQVFAMNTDQPGKNVRFWRPQTSYGKWRWMWWDLDDTFIFGPHNPYDRDGLVFSTGLDSINALNINPVTPPPAWAPNGPVQTFPLRALLGSPEFRIDFIVRFADLLNTAFQPDYLHHVVDSFHNRVSPYLEEHYRRWHRPEPEIYEDHLQRLYDFSTHRHSVMREHITQFFNLSGSYSLSLDVGSGKGHIRINTIELTPSLPSLDDPVYPWNGEYFMDIPLEVEAIAEPGYVFSHWSGEIQSTETILTLSPEDDTELIAHFAPIEQEQVIAFWYFDTDLPNNTPLEHIDPVYDLTEGSRLHFYSSLEGYPFEQGHPLWRKASLERRNKPTALNYRPEAVSFMPYNPGDMRGIQVRQPFVDEQQQNTLLLQLPTVGFYHIRLSFAAMDEGAAENILVEYSLDENNETWQSAPNSSDTLALFNQYMLYSIDFSDIDEASDNEHFSIRIRFAGDDMQADDGERITLNNLVLEGEIIPEPVSYRPFEDIEEFRVFPNPVTGHTVYLSKESDIKLFDMQGRLLSVQQNVQFFPVGNLSPGIYMVKNQRGERAKIIIPH